MTEEAQKPLLERLPDGTYLIHIDDKIVRTNGQDIQNEFLKAIGPKQGASFSLLIAWLNRYYRMTAETEIWFKKKRLLENFEFYMRLGKEKMKRGEKLIDNNWG